MESERLALNFLLFFTQNLTLKNPLREKHLKTGDFFRLFSRRYFKNQPIRNLNMPNS